MTTSRKKALFIVNPVSGKMRIKNELFAILKLFSDSGYESSVLMTSKRGDAMSFALYCPSDLSVIVACGGDGTLNEVVSGLMQRPENERPKVGFIPAGTTNDLAETHGIPKDPKKAAELIISGNAAKNDVGTFNGTRYFNYVASCGAFADVSYTTSQSAKNMLGHFAYVLGGIKSLAEIKPRKMKITSDEYSEEGEFVYAGVTNALSVGGMFKFDKNDVSLDDGSFEVLLVRKPINASFYFDMMKMLSKKVYDDKSVVFFRASDIKIECETPVGWTVDGEYAGDIRSAHILNICGGIEIIK